MRYFRNAAIDFIATRGQRNYFLLSLFFPKCLRLMIFNIFSYGQYFLIFQLTIYKWVAVCNNECLFPMFIEINHSFNIYIAPPTCKYLYFEYILYSEKNQITCFASLLEIFNKLLWNSQERSFKMFLLWLKVHYHITNLFWRMNVIYVFLRSICHTK